MFVLQTKKLITNKVIMYTTEALEKTDIVSLRPQYELFVGGKFVAPTRDTSVKTSSTSEPSAGDNATGGSSTRDLYFDSINPATEAPLARIAQASAQDVDAAVQAARRAYDTVWSKISATQRGRYLFRIARLIQERAREFAVLETIDGGKPIRESRDVDIPLAAAHFFYHAGWCDKLEYLTTSQPFGAVGPHGVAQPSGVAQPYGVVPSSSVARPYGVVGQIIPWNFPLLMAAWKLAPALAAGNTVVLKPAETTSLTALLLAEVLQEAELPAGVVNIVTGDGRTGAALVQHRGFDKLAFTGSTEVGRLIREQMPRADTPLTLELGGKSAHIIYDDAALDQAVEAVINGIYFNQGHVCCAGSRLLVQEGVYDEVLEKLRHRIERLRIGNPLDKNTDIGAINSAPELKKIRALIQQGQHEGGEYFESSQALPSKGYFCKPCFFSDVSTSSFLFRKEIFGPVLGVSTFRTPEEAVQKANNTRYGLAAGVWSDKASKIQHTARLLKAGVVWANTYNKFDPSSPFGGYNESGMGREGGRHGMLEYLGTG